MTTGSGDKPDTETLQRALVCLVRLIRDEYPDDRSLVEIAVIWGRAQPDEIEAIEAVHGLLEGYQSD